MSAKKLYPWIGPKTHMICIRVTAAEHRELQCAALAAGGIGMSWYLLGLHYRATGVLS